MEAFVLVGGIGSRLKPYTVTIPKPMLPIGNIPILEIVIRQLVDSGATKIYLSLGYLPHLVRAHVESMSLPTAVQIEYIYEHSPMGTAGALSLLPEVPKSPLLVLNGDLLTDINYVELFEFHSSQNTEASVAVTSRTVPIDYGVVETDDAGLSLLNFSEKPTLRYRVCMGIYVISPTVFRYLDSGSRIDMPQLLDKLVKSGSRVSTYISEDYWQDIGRLEDFDRANADFQQRPERFLGKL
jgi:NDP-sugar pyrophosphorylase family protein